MGLFPVVHADRLAPGAFQQPVPIPQPLPGAEPLVTVCFNRDWLPYILGCLTQLCLNSTWDTTDQDELNQIFGEANNLILIFSQALSGCQTKNPAFAGAEPDYMLRQNPDNPCELQTSVDGITWCTWADLSKCITGSQPGNGSPQPASGKCQSFHGNITPTGSWVLPVPVNTGDQITVTNLQGSWSPTQFTDIWLCPDGNLFFGGFCADGTQAFDAGAPMPSAPLNGTILFDGTNFYDVSSAANPGTPAVVTIAPGVSNAQLIIRCNFHGGTEPAGSVGFDIQICNNQPATWTHTFDFATNNGGWTPHARSGSAPAGVWSAGSGWTTSDVTEVGGGNPSFRRVNLIKTFASTDITQLQIVINLTKGTYSNPSAEFGLAVGLNDLSGTLEVNELASAMSNGDNQLFIGTTPVTATGIEVYLASSDDTTGNFSGSALISKIIVSGTGTDPFGGP